MATTRARFRPALEALETKLALSTAHAMHVPMSAHVDSIGAAPSTAVPAGGTYAVLNGFVNAYRSHVGDPNYNPAYDLNHNGQIGQTDGRLLLHALPPLSPRIPLALRVTLAPQDKAKGRPPANSGGVTHSREPTVLGRTTPGALIFSGTGALDVKLRGPAVVADSHGDFAYKTLMADGINQLDFQVVDPYGRQLLFAFPIYWLDFARYENAHPRKT